VEIKRLSESIPEVKVIEQLVLQNKRTYQLSAYANFGGTITKMELGGSNINITAHLQYIKLIQRSVYKTNIFGDDTSQSPFDQIENFGVYTIGLTKG